MKRKWLFAGFVLAGALTLFFALRAVMFAVFWMDPNKDRHPVEPWMTPRYIVRTYDLPRDELAAILGLTPGENPRESVDALAQKQGLDPTVIVREIQALVDKRPSP